MHRVRFAPSPTGFLHIGSARTYIFNWLFARHSGGTMILRIDDTDVGRNTDASETSIFDGLSWLGLDWDEQYRQSERLALHRAMAEAILEKGLAYRDFTPAQSGDSEKSGAQGTWLFNAGMRELSREESDRRAAAGEPFALRFRVPHDRIGHVKFNDAVYGEQAKAYADIEDFALLRSDGVPTYHLANCADDADLRITHIIRGQEHLSNAFKHQLIFDAAGAAAPTFAHLPLLMAPDGMKLSKRVHGPVVSVTTYRDAGFLPHGVHQLPVPAGMVAEERPRKALARGDGRAVHPGRHQSGQCRGQLHGGRTVRRQGPLAERGAHSRHAARRAGGRALAPFFVPAGTRPEKLRRITPLIQERMKLLRDVQTVADFFFVEQLPPYDAAELIPKKGDAAMARSVLVKACEVLATAEFAHDPLEAALRAASVELGIKAGQMFEPVRVAVCGRKTAPPLFGTLEALGREACLVRIAQAIEKL